MSLWSMSCLLRDWLHPFPNFWYFVNIKVNKRLLQLLTACVSISISSSCQTKPIPQNSIWFAQSAGAVEYTDCFSAEGYDPLNKCPGYDTKQCDSKVPIMLKLWGMQSTSSLLLIKGPLWLGVGAPMGQTELNCVGWDGTVFAFMLYVFVYLC